MKTKNEYLCPTCMSIIKLSGSPMRSFMGFYKIFCPICKKEFRYPLSPGYTAFYWILLLGNVVWMIYLISQSTFSLNPIGVVVLIFAIISLVKSSKLRSDINQLKENISTDDTGKTTSKMEPVGANFPDHLLLQTTCKKCGNKGLDYDHYWKEYTCKSCGWQTKKIDQ